MEEEDGMELAAVDIESPEDAKLDVSSLGTYVSPACLHLPKGAAPSLCSPH